MKEAIEWSEHVSSYLQLHVTSSLSLPIENSTTSLLALIENPLVSDIASDFIGMIMKHDYALLCWPLINTSMESTSMNSEINGIPCK